jgi:hypothetical protein
MCIDRIEHFHNGVSSKCRTYLIKEDSTAIKAGVYNSKRKKILKKYITKYEKIFKTKIENYN